MFSKQEFENCFPIIGVDDDIKVFLKLC